MWPIGSFEVYYLSPDLLRVKVPAKVLKETAKQWIGTPYKPGGKSLQGADCSGFVYSVFLSVGIRLPRYSWQQWQVGVEIPKQALFTGDLVFFKTVENGHPVSHVGIYMENSKFIHASSSHGVTISSLNDEYWKDKFVGARRICLFY